VHSTEFESLVEKALEQIPMHFRHVMQNVAILVEEWPDSVVVEEITGCRDEIVYGLFSGTPLSEQHIEDNGVFPPVIAIYQGPLVEDFPEPDELIAEIEITLVHEIAHFMGLDEEAVRVYGYD
tara:strand:+ start:8 stop:376 length:369 start_codon:yes stop_codon:yes gene_type:complete